MNFAHSDYFAVLFISLFAAACLIVGGLIIKKKKIDKLASSGIMGKIAPDFSRKMQTLRAVCLFLGLIFLALSIAGPQWGRKVAEETLKGIEVIIALDCSQSMAAQDYKPSRLDFSKAVAIKLIDALKGNKIGIIAYAGEAYLECPLTTDFDAAKLFMDYADYSIMPIQGTDIGKTINLALSIFTPGDSSSKALILISDGENFSSDVIKAAELARKQGVSIYAIGIGSPEGATLIIDGKEKKDRNGNTVVSRLDENLLKQISSLTEGTYIHADYESATLEKTISAVLSLEKKDLGVKSENLYINRFQYTLFPAFVFLFISFAMGERRILIYGKK